MQKVYLDNYYYEYDSEEELDTTHRALLEAAGSAVENAYAPYSGFSVGTALLLENGNIITGNNQENAAYPSGLCAERVALFYASANFPDIPVTVMAITAKSKLFSIDTPVSPCGSCRQVIAEYEKKSGKKIKIILRGGKGKVFVFEGIDHLLPLVFSAELLKK